MSKCESVSRSWKRKKKRVYPDNGIPYATKKTRSRNRMNASMRIGLKCKVQRREKPLDGMDGVTPCPSRGSGHILRQRPPQWWRFGVHFTSHRFGFGRRGDLKIRERSCFCCISFRLFPFNHRRLAGGNSSYAFAPLLISLVMFPVALPSVTPSAVFLALAEAFLRLSVGFLRCRRISSCVMNFAQEGTALSTSPCSRICAGRQRRIRQ